MHAFCHCLPGPWHQMAVMLSAAASCLVGRRVAGPRRGRAARRARRRRRAAGALVPALPLGRAHAAQRPGRARRLRRPDARDRPRRPGRAVLEGVAFALRRRPGRRCAAPAPRRRGAVIGGGARSALWAQCSPTRSAGRSHHADGEVGPAFGAARLAAWPRAEDRVARQAARAARCEPDPSAPALRRAPPALAPLYPLARELAR